MPFWKKTDKGGKKKPPKSAVPRTAQQSIPMQRMFEDGTCRVKPNYYTRTIQYQDINYQLAQQEDKTAIFEEWCSFLNFFDSSIKFELSFVNMAADSTEFEKSIRIPYQRDGFDDVRAEYSQMLRQQLAKGNNGLTKTKFITFGVEGESMAQVKPRLDHIQNDLLNNFHRLGVQAKPMNGVQRLKLILRNGGKDLPILCKVYTGMTVEQEALLFAEQNGFSAPLTAGIKLRAKVVGGDAISKAFLAATNRVGLSLNYDSQQLTDYRIGCVGTAFRLYKQMGEPLYCETMRLIVAAWEGKPDSFRASVLKGMMHFVELYHGEFSEERLLRALRSIHPVDIYRIGQDDPAKLRGWKKYVFPIYTAYNGKCRKDALPMKF